MASSETSSDVRLCYVCVVRRTVATKLYLLKFNSAVNV